MELTPAVAETRVSEGQRGQRPRVAVEDTLGDGAKKSGERANRCGDDRSSALMDELWALLCLQGWSAALQSLSLPAAACERERAFQGGS